ncbi:TIGR03620 family F420-dependent LLM class oxidoreductase [Streptomyces sp. RFCAC02]|uniref:TIGR03620 family F420-dependent LLM class oxidoreductase n=1 Tax=Streptomyces sp. RFCAC02 TaxID=2499143 RepID=UPI00101F8B3E|nr:TIGR03620 family F420-dependent LLM class oxidoreductase [Streptomyces sp. RFCAC02]
MTTALTDTIGRVGIWSGALRGDDPARRGVIAEAAAEIEELGYGAVWIGGSPAPVHAVPVLAATSRLTVATGITGIWDRPAADTARAFTEVNASYGGRFVLGIGASHSALHKQYHRPYSSMVAYLDTLDAADSPVPADRRVLAALGPKMLRLARDRSAGAHPYLVTAEHVAQAREELGDTALLAPELKVVLDPDLDGARATARAYLTRYLALPNYTNNLLRLGFTEDDFASGGSDRLLDAVYGLGDATAIRAAVDRFLDAGADHVAVQVVSDGPMTDIPLAAYRTLAEALPLGAATD